MSPPFDIRDMGIVGYWDLAQSPYGTDFNNDWRVFEKEFCRTVDYRKVPRKWKDFDTTEATAPSRLVDNSYQFGPGYIASPSQDREPEPPYIGQVFYVKGDREFVYWTGSAWKVMFMGRYPVAGKLSCSFSWVKDNVDFGSLVVQTPFMLPASPDVDGQAYPREGAAHFVPLYKNDEQIGRVMFPKSNRRLLTSPATWFEPGDVLRFGSAERLGGTQHVFVTLKIFLEDPWPTNF